MMWGDDVDDDVTMSKHESYTQGQIGYGEIVTKTKAGRKEKNRERSQTCAKAMMISFGEGVVKVVFRPQG